MTDRPLRRAHVLLIVIGVMVLAALIPFGASAQNVDVDELPFTSACVSLHKTLAVGEQTTIAAGHVGAEAEVTYRWFRAVAGEGQFVRPSFTAPGEKAITVVAYNEDGDLAASTCFITVTAAIGGQPGIGGAPGELGQAAPSATREPTSRGEEQPTTSDEVDGEGDTEDAVGDALEGEGATSVGRIILWVAIIIIVIFLIVLFWRRYNNEHGETTSSKPLKEKRGDTKEKTLQEKLETIVLPSGRDAPPIGEEDIKESEDKERETPNFFIPPTG